jgi:SAM-dependent methyltransferase
MNLLSLYDSVERENRRVILSMVEENRNARILDCGCNDGGFTKLLAEKVGTTDIHGIEFIDESAQLAEGKGIRVYRANLNDRFPLEDETFDFVHANQVIEHLYETDGFIKEIYRVLRKGGYAIISTNNLAGFYNIISLVLGKQPFPAHISNEVILGNSLDPKHGVKHGSKGTVHYRVFAYAALRELLAYHGFKIETYVGVGFYPFPNRIAKFLTWIDKRHAVYLTTKVRK